MYRFDKERKKQTKIREIVIGGFESVTREDGSGSVAG